ncbi:uncharacterized protein LOC134538841 isoform X2 [Bacillus rossius redtenbacheri]|uniref:uncharacterized protein LOC134538841 isoform X2 n=1 Tax=Bacillus rossius redtenbacheri TaxID=93214 RepID=UPI002FDD18A3
MPAAVAVVLWALLPPLLGARAQAGGTLCDAAPCRCDSTTLQFGRVTCSCAGTSAQELVLRSNDTQRIPETTTSLLVSNCSKVLVQQHALRGLQALRSVEISNVAELEVRSHGFDWNESIAAEGVPPRGIVVRIVNASLPAVPSYAFRGRLDAVLLTGVRVRVVETFAFVSLSGMERLELVDCSVDELQSQALKRFSVQYLVVSGGRLALLPSHALMDLEVHREVLIKRVAIDTMHSAAVRIVNPLTFRMIDSTVGRMAGEALRVSTRGPIIVQNNKFASLGAGAFLGFSVDQQFRARHGRQELIFENNTIAGFTNNSLVVDGTCFDPRFFRVYVDRACSCEALESWSFQLVTFSSGSLPRAGSPQPAEVLTGFWCRQKLDRQPYVRFQEYSNYHCGYTTRNVYVFIAAIVAGLFGLLLIVLLAILVWRRRRARRQKEWINVPPGERDDAKKPTKDRPVGDRRLKMVVPDGRTYRETELHVIVERAEPLRQPN